MAHAAGYQCPFCGSEVKVGSRCPGCKPKPPAATPPADPKPWEQGETHDGLDLPDEDFDYDDFVAREFGRSPHRKLGVKWYWWALALGLAALLLLLIASNRW